MRSRSDPEKIRFSFSSDLALIDVKERVDRLTKTRFIGMLALCLSIFSIGCATRHRPRTAFIPPISASTLRGTADKMPGSLLVDKSPSSATPGVQVQNVGGSNSLSYPGSNVQAKNETASGKHHAFIEQEIASTPSLRRTKPRPSLRVSEPALRKKSVKRPPKVVGVSGDGLDLRVVPADDPMGADFSVKRAEKSLTVALTSSEKHRSATGKNQSQTPLGKAASRANLPSAVKAASAKNGQAEPEDERLLRGAYAGEYRIPSAATETKTPGLPTAVSLNGTFAGASLSIAKGLGELTFTILGSGNEVIGTWSSEHGRSGKLTGTLVGPALIGLRLEQYGPCAGTYTGAATVVQEGSRLDGSYSGRDCGGNIDGSFVVLKQ